jgi:hypothetical protein
MYLNHSGMSPFTPLDYLQVLIWCVNLSIWYGLTNELVSTLLKHIPHVVPHVFTLQVESSLQFQNQALPKSDVSEIKLWKMMTKKLTQKSLHTGPWAVPYIASRARAQSSQQVVEEVVPSHELQDKMCPETWCPSMSCKTNMYNS